MGLMLVGCAPQKPEAVVTLGQGRLGVVFFPDAWTTTQPPAGATVSPGKRYLNFPEEFQVRGQAGSATEELIFGVRSLGASSENHYATSVDGRFRVRPASDEEWNNAAQVPRPQPPPFIDGNQWRGKTFPGSGQSLSRIVPSPRQTFVAVLSYTGTNHPQPSFLGGGEPSEGTMYLDLYNAESGQKLAAGRASYSGYGAGSVFRFAAWTDDAVLIVPVDNLAQTCFLAILPVQ